MGVVLLRWHVDGPVEVGLEAEHCLAGVGSEAEARTGWGGGMGDEAQAYSEPPPAPLPTGQSLGA